MSNMEDKYASVERMKEKVNKWEDCLEQLENRERTIWVSLYVSRYVVRFHNTQRGLGPQLHRGAQLAV